MISISDFWQFSLDSYPKQQDELLSWQDNQGGNVNLALLCQYLDTQELALTQSQIVDLHDNAKQFEHSFTAPLRQLRGQYKRQQNQLTEYPLIRQRLLDAELELERQQQRALVDALNNFELTTKMASQSSWLTYQSWLQSR